MRTTLLALCLFLSVYRAASLHDTDGDQVLNAGGAYYLVPVYEKSGGLALATVGNDSSSATVVVDPTLSEGFPVRFGSPILLPWVNSGKFVHIIMLISEPAKPTSPTWTVEKEFPIGWAVKVTRFQTSFMGPFAIYPVEKGYKITYYPDRGITGAPGADLGIVYSGGYHRLVVKDGDPFIFKIKKAFEPTARMSEV